jgi:hypothetical protein
VAITTPSISTESMTRATWTLTLRCNLTGFSISAGIDKYPGI